MSLYSTTSLSALKTDFPAAQLTAVSALFTGTQWTGGGLSYSFPDASADYGATADDYGFGEAHDGFAQPTSAFQAQVRQGFAMLSGLISLNFTELTGDDDRNATLRFGLTNDTATAFGYAPGATGEAGDTWYAADQPAFDDPVAGGYGFFTILHELGHALGLKHGHDDSGYGALPADLDGLPSSLMTYRSHYGADTSYYTNAADSFPQSFMPYDIAALQSLYGANLSSNSGRTVYSWDAVSGEMSIDGAGQGAPIGAEVFSTIWDGGGRDVLWLRNFSEDQTVDLRPGGGAKFSTPLLADLSSSVQADANVYFALSPAGSNQALIEVVKTGGGDDVILGNDFGNKVSAGRGHDTVSGGGGDDNLKGNGQRDTMHGGTGDDWLRGGGGRDTLYGDSGNDRLDGGPGRDTLIGGGGADIFVFRANTKLDRVLDFELGIDHVEVSDPDLVSVTELRGHATLALGHDLMVLKGMEAAGLNLDDILV